MKSNFDIFSDTILPLMKFMKLQQLLQDPGYKKKFVLEKLLAHFLNKTREELWIDSEFEIDSETLTTIQKAYREYVEDEKPLEYILGYVEFFGVKFWVNEHTLIPRPETEYMISALTEYLQESQLSDFVLLDIGTGSGAIALALAKNRPDWSVTAADISQDALDLANENAKNQNLQIFLKKSDCFTEISEKYDIIVSNPPYISREDESEIGLNVLHSEPHLALFADEDGLAIYRRIAEDAKDYLKDGGKIYLEIGYKQGQSVPELFRKHLPEKRVRTLKDQFGQDRMVVVDDGQD